jgi:hypothetical protein
VAARAADLLAGSFCFWKDSCLKFLGPRVFFLCKVCKVGVKKREPKSKPGQNRGVEKILNGVCAENHQNHVMYSKGSGIYQEFY